MKILQDARWLSGQYHTCHKSASRLAIAPRTPWAEQRLQQRPAGPRKSRHASRWTSTPTTPGQSLLLTDQSRTESRVRNQVLNRTSTRMWENCATGTAPYFLFLKGIRLSTAAVLDPIMLPTHIIIISSFGHSKGRFSGSMVGFRAI